MSEVIVTKGLELRYRRCHALKGLNLTVESGTVFAILGENGAGKSSLIRILTGFQHPNAGSCMVCGLDPIKDALQLRRRIGYVSDAPALYDWMKVGEIGWFAASFYPDGFLEKYKDTIARFEVPLEQRIRELSKGQRAKVALSLAMAHDPELLILDEPTSGLDPLVRREFLESMVEVAAVGRTVFLSSHQITEVERVADRVAILHKGELRWCGSLTQLRESVSEVTISCNDPLVTLPNLSSQMNVLREESDGRQHRWFVENLTPEAISILEKSFGVVSVRSRPATLEELFIACTRGTSPASFEAKADSSQEATKSA